MNPNLFILGFPKCGTTSLAAMLKDVDYIYTPVNKEPHIFNQTLSEAKARLGLYTKGAKSGCLYYLDATPNYIKNIDGFFEVAANLGVPLSQAKFLVCVRDPAERYVSHYKHNFNRGTEPRPMDKVLDQEVDLYRKGMLHEAQYLDYSFYKEKIECLVQKVGGGNVAIIDISDLNSPSLLAMKLQPFLGLNRQIELTSARANEAYNPNSKLLNKILFSQNRVFSIMRKIVPKKYSQAIKAFFMRINNSSKMIVPKEDIGVETLKTVLKNEMEFYESIAK